MKLRLYFSVLFLLWGQLFSQSVISIPELTSEIGDVVIPINTTDLGNVGSFTIRIDYDSSVLQFRDFVNNPFSNDPNFLFVDENGRLSFVWFSVNPVLITSKFFDLEFQYKGGESDISFIGTNEVTDASANPLQVNFVDGKISQIVSDIHDENKNIDFNLDQNYPNPFNPVTNFSFTIPFASEIIFYIYDVRGKLVSTLLEEYKEAGQYTVSWNAKDQPSGIYFYTIELNGNRKYKATKKMLLLK